MVGNTAGRVVAIFDAIFQDGYNSLTGVTVERTGNTATYTKNSHGFTSQKGQIVKIGGFDQADYNVTGPIFNVLANSWDMTVANNPQNPGTGSGTAQHAPIFGAGSKTHSGTSLGTYRPATGNRFYLAVDSAASTLNARLRVFETVSAAGTAVTQGTNPCPLDAQVNGGLYFIHADASNSTARPWICVSNGTFVIFLCSYTATTTTGTGFMFGDFWSRKPTDSYNTLLVADNAAGNTGTSIVIPKISASSGTGNGDYMLRGYSGVAGAVNGAKIADYFRNGTAVTEMGASGLPFPHPIEGGLSMGPVWMRETNTTGIRATIPGIWIPFHQRPIAHGDTFSGGAGTPLAGKTFEAYNVGSAGQIIVETSDTWTAPT
jgi:hypothetical protein